MSFFSKACLGRCLLAATLAAACPWLAIAQELPEVQKLIERRDFRQALVKVNQHLALRPDSIDGRFLKGVVLAESNEPQQAIEIFTQLTKDAPQMLEAYNNLGVLQARQQEYDKARATLEVALKVDPTLSAVAGNLRNTYGRLAKQAYDKALGQEGAVPSSGKNLVLLSQLRAPSPAPEKAPEVPASKPSAVAPPPPAAVTAAVTASVPARPAVSSREKEVSKAVDAWAEAWMSKDMNAYLAAYASDFKVPGKLSRKEWERERRKRITSKKDRIQLSLEKLDIDVQDDVATARFLQRYKAGSFAESTRKTLTLTRQGGRWRIQSER